MPTSPTFRAIELIEWLTSNQYHRPLEAVNLTQKPGVILCIVSSVRVSVVYQVTAELARWSIWLRLIDRKFSACRPHVFKELIMFLSQIKKQDVTKGGYAR